MFHHCAIISYIVKSSDTKSILIVYPWKHQDWKYTFYCLRYYYKALVLPVGTYSTFDDDFMVTKSNWMSFLCLILIVLQKDNFTVNGLWFCCYIWHALRRIIFMLWPVPVAGLTSLGRWGLLLLAQEYISSWLDEIKCLFVMISDQRMCDSSFSHKVEVC